MVIRKMAKDGLRFLGGDQVNCDCNILDKETARINYVQYMLDRTNRIFRYTGLPDTIPEYMLELMLQCYGSVAIIRYNNSLYAMRAYFGGPPDPYYRPTQATIANPALNIQSMYRIINHLPPFNSDEWATYPTCVRFINDTCASGLIPMFSRYAAQMAENDVSIRSAQINLRQQTIIVANTGTEIQSAQEYIKKLEDGELASIQQRPFSEGVRVASASPGNGNVAMQLIELQQYLKASWYNDIGLNANYNMKREYISKDELGLSDDTMLPLVDDMFRCRQLAIEAINKEFGTDISVEKDSAWEESKMKSGYSSVPSYFPNETDPFVNEPIIDELDPFFDEEVQSTEPTDSESVEDSQISEDAEMETIANIQETVDEILEIVDEVDENGANDDT